MYFSIEYLQKITGLSEYTTKMYLCRFNYRKKMRKTKDKKLRAVYFLSDEQLKEFKTFIRKMKQSRYGV